jgi:hypothetical protein
MDWKLQKLKWERSMYSRQKHVKDGIANSNDEVSDQNISKFFVSQVKESMAGHVGVNGVY